MMEKRNDGKRFESKCEKNAICTDQENCINENFLSFQAQLQFVEEWEATPFYASNVTVGCFKNASK